MQRLPDLKQAAWEMTSQLSSAQLEAVLPNPVIILSAPRSGSNFLFEQLAAFDYFWTIGGESHGVFRSFPHLRAQNPQLDSMALGEAHADPQTCDLLRRCFLALLKNRQGTPFLSLPPAHRSSDIYLLEKTPRNALNIPFLLKVFPKARFIYLHRDPRETVSSLIEAWTLGMQAGQFVTFRDLPDWHLPGWCFLLPPGWREMRGKSLAEIAAFQWRAANTAIMNGLSTLETDRWTSIDYAALNADTPSALGHVHSELGIDVQSPLATHVNPGLSRTTVSEPRPDKWKRHEPEITPLLPQLLEVNKKIETFCGKN